MPEKRNESLIRELRGRVAASAEVRSIEAGLGKERIDVTGLPSEARALVLAALAERTRRKIAVILPGEGELAELEGALRLFATDPRCVATYPNPSLSPYQEVDRSLGTVKSEVEALGLLISNRVEVLIVPARSLFRRLPSRHDFGQRILRFASGSEIDPHHILEVLVTSGYTRTDLVGEVGDFAFRGGILDLFPPNCSNPLRIELFGDTIESIREFETETQRSLDVIEVAEAYPVLQFPATRDVRTKLARKLSVDFNLPLYKKDLNEKIERLNENATFPGIENYLPLASESSSFLEYLDDEWLVVWIEPDEITNSLAKYETLLRREYEITTEKGKAVYSPDTLLVPADRIHEFLGRSALAMSEVHVAARKFKEIHFRGAAAKRYVNRLSEIAADVDEARRARMQQLIFVATHGGREKTERLLKEFSVAYVDDPPGLTDDPAVTSGNLARGFALESISLSVLSEWDLFDPPTSTRLGGRKRTSDTFMTDLRDLKAGDYIVHVDHGVGVFKGLQRIPFGDTEREVMEIEYSSGGKLLMPMESLNLIQKYSAGGDIAPPKLDKLGGTSWARTKASVKKAMRDMADELLKLYATRQMISGHAFGSDTPWQVEFEEAFEFDETEDQISAVMDIKSDMESRKPMDRLLCGDVGYGKTEVAMRAAFKAVMDGRQVAILAPTTILAYQHFRTFLRRFASFPVTIELMSRHWSTREQKEVAKKLATGEIDILVGTHRILSKDIEFKDLGLVIIDEEQRFGVAQKERLKQLKKSVDVLAMSATPIPRTLHMSLSGIRDISIIETPPKDRLAIQTAVVPFDDEFIREAIEFELGRGGQIFFVHNRIESIYAMKEYLEKVVPGLRVIVGHGQMDERELEKAMLAFISREYDVLLSTTIIENGIDIPACNTILINHAERFGLSQLYQLRGRVGRSDRLAFCYLLVPSDRILSSDARKRLAAIQEFSDLGAGFRIAARDLEIRGAGNLLGGEQSGQIAAVGFEMYTKLLEETIRELKGEQVEEEIETSMSLGIDIYIPQEYIADQNLRMMFYKRIASARDEERLESIRNELRDRFGALPGNVESLLNFIRLKQLAKAIGVVSIVRERATAAIKFHPQAKIDPNKLLSLLNGNAAAKFTPAGVLSIPLSSQGADVIDELEELLRGTAAAA